MKFQELRLFSLGVLLLGILMARPNAPFWKLSLQFLGGCSLGLWGGNLEYRMRRAQAAERDASIEDGATAQVHGVLVAKRSRQADDLPT